MVLSRLLLFLAVLGSLVFAAAAAAESGGGATTARAPLASVRLAECSRADQAAGRLAVFRGAMRRVAGTGQMWMRFRLQERVGQGSFRTVKAEGLDAWRKSRPGVRRFAYRQRVLALAQGSAYRTVVSFRWYGEGGKEIRRAKRRSPTCRQPGLLPDLRVVRIGGGNPLAGVPKAVGYTVNVINRGRAAAGRFDVNLAVDGNVVDTQTAAGLAPGESRKLFFAGPACEGAVTARADADDAVREAQERDNVLTSACP